MAPSRDSRISSQVTSQDIVAAIAKAGLETLPSLAIEQLTKYLHLLLRWNSRINLTAIREPHEIVRRHLVECVQCAQLLPPVSTLLDFGSGAGLPGIPIAIVRPETRVTLGESQGKKTAFLGEVVRALSLNAQVYSERVENMPTDRLFDAVTLRAVDRMADACRAASLRVGPNGWLVVFATSATEPSIAQLPEIAWKNRVLIPTLKDGFLLFGQRKNVSRGTSEYS